MGQSKNVLAYAKSQVGYKEGYSNGHWNNSEKYGAMIGMPEASRNQWPWCAIFVFACLKNGGCGSGGLTTTAAVANIYNEGKRKKRFSKYPAVGSIGIINGGEHTFLVYAWDSNYIYTYEGNSNDNGSSEGTGVYSHKRSRAARSITGYVYPYYDEYANSADPAFNKKWLGAGKAPVPTTSTPAKTPTKAPTKPVVTKPATPVVVKPTTPVVTKPTTPTTPTTPSKPTVPVVTTPTTPTNTAPVSTAQKLPDPATPNVSSGGHSSTTHVTGDNGVFVPVTLGYILSNNREGN